MDSLRGQAAVRATGDELPSSALFRGELGYVLRFLAIGVLNTLIGLGTIYFCKYFLSVPDIPANAVGYTIGLINSFFWNRRWTFSHQGNASSAIFRFLLVFLVAYLANLGTMLILNSAWRVNSYLGHAISTIPYTVIFYLGSRYFVFRGRSRFG